MSGLTRALVTCTDAEGRQGPGGGGAKERSKERCGEPRAQLKY